MTRKMKETEIEVLEEHHPTSLPARKLLGLMEVSQILVIGEEGYRVRSSLQVVAPVVKSMDDSE